MVKTGGRALSGADSRAALRDAFTTTLEGVMLPDHAALASSRLLLSAFLLAIAAAHGVLDPSPPQRTTPHEPSRSRA